ncbi:MAG: alpha/beta hydrolase, partial [Planctomycetales bacterium]|nr:alpha/beta hydrolase [Planctomycetales bacterium]
MKIPARRRWCCFLSLMLPLAITASVFAAPDTRSERPLAERVEEHFTTNPTDDTKIHYVSLGEGPLLVMIHGFPDFWYSWADQMETLSSQFRCVAIDCRGYNQSDKPQDVASYDMSLLMGDISAVIEDCGAKHATIVGHDWGGAIAWSLALTHPDQVDHLIVCNLPHPRGLKRELLINDQHRANTQYARDFQNSEAHKLLTANGLVQILRGLAKRPWSEKKQAAYRQAFERSDFNGMLNYYRRNYNPELKEKAPLPYVDDEPVVKAKMPVLMFHGLQDTALHHHALNE